MHRLKSPEKRERPLIDGVNRSVAMFMSRTAAGWADPDRRHP
jgi:hypothetical protein